MLLSVGLAILLECLVALGGGARWLWRDAELGLELFGAAGVLEQRSVRRDATGAHGVVVTIASAVFLLSARALFFWGWCRWGWLTKLVYKCAGTVVLFELGFVRIGAGDARLAFLILAAIGVERLPACPTGCRHRFGRGLGICLEV